MHCQIIPRNDVDSDSTWADLKESNAIPVGAKSHVHESRNGIMMCMNHHKSFDDGRWFVR